MITSSGVLALTAPTDVTFESQQLTGRQRQLQRGGGWQLYVKDTRGYGGQWRLSVKAATFVNEVGDHLLGSPIYVSREGKTMFGQELTPIVTHKTTNEQAQENSLYDVTNDWDMKTGMFLAIDGGATAGDYHGELTWSLDDVPN